MSLGELLDRLRGVKALVVGDLMLDEYIFGRATRISPEAPVMVVRQQRTAAVPGGAANVALNVAALGAQVSLVGVTGNDEAGRLLTNALRESALSGDGLIVDDERPTTRKTRILADSAHQVLRIDHEFEAALSEQVEGRLIERVLAQTELADVVILSDYLKGTLTPNLARAVLDACKAAGKPVVVNPKPSSFKNYSGATLLSLNRSETAQAVGWADLNAFGSQGARDLPQRAAQALRSELAVDHILVTLGEQGMCTEDLWVSAPAVAVYDTAGAGDTVVATVALGLRAVGYKQEVFDLAAQTSAAVVKKVGVAVPSPEDLEDIRRL